MTILLQIVFSRQLSKNRKVHVNELDWNNDIAVAVNVLTSRKNDRIFEVDFEI